MLAFFYSIFRALMVGGWVDYPYAEVSNKLTTLTNRIFSWVINALGGKFETLQTFELFDSTLQPANAIAAILAVAAIVSVCLAVFKLTKMVFSIFFGGR